MEPGMLLQNLGVTDDRDAPTCSIKTINSQLVFVYVIAKPD